MYLRSFFVSNVVFQLLTFSVNSCCITRGFIVCQLSSFVSSVARLLHMLWGVDPVSFSYLLPLQLKFPHSLLFLSVLFSWNFSLFASLSTFSVWPILVKLSSSSLLLSTSLPIHLVLLHHLPICIPSLYLYFSWKFLQFLLLFHNHLLHFFSPLLVLRLPRFISLIIFSLSVWNLDFFDCIKFRLETQTAVSSIFFFPLELLWEFYFYRWRFFLLSFVLAEKSTGTVKCVLPSCLRRPMTLLSVLSIRSFGVSWSEKIAMFHKSILNLCFH